MKLVLRFVGVKVFQRKEQYTTRGCSRIRTLLMCAGSSKRNESRIHRTNGVSRSNEAAGLRQLGLGNKNDVRKRRLAHEPGGLKRRCLPMVRTATKLRRMRALVAVFSFLLLIPELF
jgi:hypothetical protein